MALSLRDFVIVENLNLDFQNGFVVLTGETGAGKSITLDAIGLLLGDKADYGQVRNDAKETRLSALFDISGLSELGAQLQEQGLLEEDAEELSIRRIIDARGKSRNCISNRVATLTQLEAIGKQLIDIHGQNAHHSLSREPAQRELLDAFAGSREQAETIRQLYQNWANTEKALQETQEQAEAMTIERERLEWQFSELNQPELKPNKWETLSQSHDSLVYSAELLQTTEQIGESINSDNGTQRQIYQYQKLLGSLQNIEPRFAENLNILASIETELREISANMRDVADRSNIDPNELTARESRMGKSMSMAHKYRIEPEELPQKLTGIDERLQSLQVAINLGALENVVARNLAEYYEAAHVLSTMHHQMAGRLGEETAGHIQHLAMKGAHFDTILLSSSPTAHGLEQMQFQVAASKGNPSRPLNKVASGGELTRISLTLQVVASQYTQVPTLTFDGADTGIGGGVAKMVGKALHALDKKHQALAIAHPPQVASCSENHWQVRKHSEGKQAVSEIGVSDHRQRIGEVTRILGGEIITDTTRSHAAELLHLAAA